jgi:hypothetical protein
MQGERTTNSVPIFRKFHWQSPKGPFTVHYAVKFHVNQRMAQRRFDGNVQFFEHETSFTLSRQSDIADRFWSRITTCYLANSLRLLKDWTQVKPFNCALVTFRNGGFASVCWLCRSRFLENAFDMLLVGRSSSNFLDLSVLEASAAKRIAFSVAKVHFKTFTYVAVLDLINHSTRLLVFWTLIFYTLLSVAKSNWNCMRGVKLLFCITRSVQSDHFF